jgi:hypothetical protein
MPARDLYHNIVKAALINDGWKVTHDPYRLEYAGKNAYIDLGAERATTDAVLAAERGTTRIAVEIKTFSGLSVLTDLQQAVGQYLVYRTWMRTVEPDRQLYLAVDVETAQSVFAQEFGRIVADDIQMGLIIVDLGLERIVEWKHSPTTDGS